jgi:hypothetical protein
LKKKVEITWDDRKETQNIKVHKVDFAEASSVIVNPISAYALNKHRSRKRFEYIARQPLYSGH